MLSKLGFKLGVSPRLVSERLLSPQEKQDMLDDKITIESLEQHIIAWMKGGMCDVAHGRNVTYEQDKRTAYNLAKIDNANENNEGLTYRAPFFPYAD